AARQRPAHGDVGRRYRAAGRVAAQWNYVPGRLVPVDAAEMGGVADRAADVGAEVEPGEAGCDHGRGPAGGAARGPLQVPGVVRGAVDLVVALPVGERLRHVGLAEDHRAGGEQALDRDGVAVRNVVAQG